MSLPSNEENLHLLDTLKSVFILNHINNIVLSQSVTWNNIGSLLTWIVEYLRQDFKKLNNDTNDFEFVNLNHAMALSLLKIFSFCFEKNLLENFMTFENLKSLFFKLIFHKEVSPENSILKLYNTSVYKEFIYTPYINPELESQRLNIKHLQDKSKFVKIQKLLSFEIIDSLQFKWGNSFDAHAWILYIKRLTTEKRSVLENETVMYTLLTALSHFPCILNDDFNFKIDECQKCGSNPLNKNHYNEIDPNRRYIEDSSEASILQEIITQFFLVKLRNTPNPLLICNFLLLLYNFYASFFPSQELKTPRVMNYLLYLLSSHTNRDVRMLATRAMPLYLIQKNGEQTIDDTFKYMFPKITAIDFSSPGRCHFAESTIRAITELATVTNGERLCAIYFKLIDWLGEHNEQHSNYVYCGIINLAATKSLPPHKLLSPYLPSVADMIIKKPQVFDRIVQVSGITRKYFLNRNKEYIVPRILEYYKDPTLITQVAQAAGLEVRKLLANCLPRILATYLIKDGIDERYVIKVLSSACPDYKMISTDELFASIGETAWYILLEISMDEHGHIKNLPNINKALKCVASHAKSRNTTNNDKQQPITVTDLLEDQVLFLVQKFSDVTHSLRGVKPYLELRNSFHAMQFLIQTHVEAITSALGQLSTCLQATLEVPEFHILSLRCWNELVKNLPSSHLISLIDIIISLIFQKFESFGPEAKDIAIELLKRIYDEIKGNYSRYSLYYLSLPFLPYMKDYQLVKEFRNMKSPSRSMIFQEFNRRLQTQNEFVVKQALFDLYNYCDQFQINCQSDYFKDPGLASILTVLIRSLLDTANQFRTKTPKISAECARVLSIIGALDSNKFHFKTINQLMVIESDFEDRDEVSNFLVDLIENYMLKIFWASNDPHKQLFAVYAMQSFLSIMSLDQKVLTDKNNHVWNAFSDVGKSTLTPLLKSKYAAPRLKLEELEFPYYKLGMKYETWLVDITLYFLKRASMSERYKKAAVTRKQIFQTAAVLIQKDPNIPLCQHLLKYVALSHVVSGGIPDQLRTEFLHILNLDSKNVAPDRAEQLKLCYQTIFSVLDYFNQWVCATRESINTVESNSDSSESQGYQNISKKLLSKMNAVKVFSKFPDDLIATKAAECDAYERTIMYLENCYRDGKFDRNFGIDGVSTLQSMYANIDDYDALNGVLKKFSTNNLNEKLSTFQYSDSWSLAHESFEVLNKTVANNTKLLKSLNDHGLYDEVLSTLATRTDLNNLQSIPLDWSLMGLRASIYKGDSVQLEKWLKITDSIGKPQNMDTLINYELAKGLKFLFDSNKGDFEKSMNKLYVIIGKSLVPSVSSNFTRNINLMNQLHAIYDIGLIISSSNDSDDILQLRLSNIDQDFETQRNVLTMHNVVNKVLHNDSKISQNLLQESKLARKNDRLDISTRSIVQAMALDNQLANIEFAQLLWAEGKQSEAIKALYDILKENKFEDGSQRRAQVQLQYANWLDESNHLSSSQIIKEYNKAFELNMLSEKCNYDLGKYYNKLMESSNDETGNYEQLTIRSYLRAVSCGSNYIFETLPKLITVWLDFATTNGGKNRKSKEARQSLNQIIEDLSGNIDKIPNYAWYTVITQILSRIVHENKPSYEILCQIIISVVTEYPKHSLWYVLSHTKSTDEERRKRVTRILLEIAQNSTYYKVLDGAKRLFEKLIKIANFTIPRKSNTRQYSLVKDFEVELSDPIEALVIPVQSNLQIRLPNGGGNASINSNFKGFSRSSTITFDGFDDRVNIFHSLQMPRQVTIRGSDGKVYRLMIKSDDTRKDAKVVEFTTMINRILMTSTEARKRGLQISNYSVIPLSEKFGVIEFVKNVQTMKSIIAEQRHRMGILFEERRVFGGMQKLQKEAKDQTGKKFATLLQYFKNIISTNPPILHNWFIENFSDPTAWYIARNSFTRSSAVMSMVGYIIGLGDRHCENILIFKDLGTVLHIDFDCLFEKGLTLPTPEIVPFRLTHNMVDAMGICGVDGSFRITCEVIGGLLRENEQILMNILETLIYDPLLDWKGRSNTNPSGDLSKVRKKIRGLINEDEGLPMNIHGQVDVLIQEATSLERLCQMYPGWTPFI
ncbi:MEC1 Serine/threonine-protein kinase MEC1 [Candida maltosa Xu316]